MILAVMLFGRGQSIHMIKLARVPPEFETAVAQWRRGIYGERPKAKAQPEAWW